MVGCETYVAGGAVCDGPGLDTANWSGCGGVEGEVYIGGNGAVDGVWVCGVYCDV